MIGGRLAAIAVLLLAAAGEREILIAGVLVCVAALLLWDLRRVRERRRS